MVLYTTANIDYTYQPTPESIKVAYFATKNCTLVICRISNKNTLLYVIVYFYLYIYMVHVNKAYSDNI